MKGIFIPMEFYKVKELNGLERDVLALYKYYTEDGNNKCCSLTCQQIADELNISTRYLKMIKKHLKELGFIRTSGIKVFYVGVQVGTTVPPGVNNSSLEGVNNSSPGVKYSSPQKGSIVHPKGEVQFTHKKEKEIKKEIKKEKTNFELILDKLPQDYKTPERLTYLQKNYKDRLNKTDLSGGMLDMFLINIKNTLNKELPIEYIISKTEPKIDYVDMF